jgi:hypothetical protein
MKKAEAIAAMTDAVKTTMIYLHLLPKMDEVASPLDSRPELQAA